MNAQHIDTLTRVLCKAGTRRSLLGLLASLPVIGGLAGLSPGDVTVEAKGRRKRCKKAHKHGNGRRRKHHKGNHKKKCRSQSLGETCTGRCGQVTNNCKKTVDCVPCNCDPPCPSCFSCQGQAGQPWHWRGPALRHRLWDGQLQQWHGHRAGTL